MHHVTWSVLIGLVLAAPLGAAEPLKPVPAAKLVALFRTEHAGVRQSILDEIADWPNARLLYEPLLRAALQHETDVAVRQQVAIALVHLGQTDQPVIDELIRGLGRPHPGRFVMYPEDPLAAADALERAGGAAVSALVKTLNKSDRYRHWGVDVLGRIGPPAKPAIPALQRLLSESRRRDFHFVVEAKWRIDGDAPFALKQLLPLLPDKSAHACNGPFRVLLHMGPAAKDAVPAIAAAWRQHRSYMALRTLVELAPHHPKAAKPALWQALNSGQSKRAAKGLRRLGVSDAEIKRRSKPASRE